METDKEQEPLTGSQIIHRVIMTELDYSRMPGLRRAYSALFDAEQTGRFSPEPQPLDGQIRLAVKNAKVRALIELEEDINKLITLDRTDGPLSSALEVVRDMIRKRRERYS